MINGFKPQHHQKRVINEIKDDMYDVLNEFKDNTNKQLNKCKDN
jgi:hypothetical protein